MPGQAQVLRHEPPSFRGAVPWQCTPAAWSRASLPQGPGRGPSRALHFPPLKTGGHYKTALESPVLQEQVTSAGASSFQKPWGSTPVFPEDSPMSRCLGVASRGAEAPALWQGPGICILEGTSGDRWPLWLGRGDSQTLPLDFLLVHITGQPFLLEVLRPHTYPAVFEECSTPSGLAGTPEVGSPGPSICSRTGEAPPGWSGADPIPVLGRGPWRERMCLVTPISVLEGVTSLQTLGLAGGGGLPLSRERVTFPKSHLSAKSKRGMWQEDKTYRGTAGPVQAPTIVRWVGGSGKLPRRGVASASPSVQWDHERGTSCGRGPRRPSA